MQCGLRGAVRAADRGARRSNASVRRLRHDEIPRRPIRIHVARGDDGECTATAETTIAGVIAKLFNVRIALGFLHVARLLLTGWNSAGQVVRERLSS